jgi:hypothetical protein
LTRNTLPAERSAFFTWRIFMTIDASNRVSTGTLLFTSSEQIAAELGGDVTASVAAMMLLHAKQTREAVQTAQAIEEEKLSIYEENQIRSLHEQADWTRSAGIKEGLGLMMKGGLRIASGTVGIRASTLENGELSPGARGSQAILDGSGDGAQGGSQLLAAVDNHAADVAEADATDAEHRAEAAKRRLEDLDDQSADARKLTKDVIEFLRDQARTKASTDNAAASIRG